MLHFQDKILIFANRTRVQLTITLHFEYIVPRNLQVLLIKKGKLFEGFYTSEKVRQLISISKKNIDLLINKRGVYCKNTATFWSKERKQICTGTNLFFVPFLSDVYDVRQLLERIVRANNQRQTKQQTLQ